PGIPDTVRVEQKLTAGPSQHIQVQVSIINDATLGGFVIPLSFYNPDNLDVKCDSIHWVTRFTSNPATMYAGSVGYENYIDTLNHKLNIWGVWYGTPLAAGNGPICTIYFTTGSTWKSDIGIIIDSTTVPPTNQLEFTDAATGNGFMPKYSPGCLGAAFQVLAPNGGEVWYVGESKNILWRSVGFTGNVKLELSTNSGTSWSTIIASTGNTGTYAWTIPNSPSATNRVRVSDATDGSPKDASDANFSIPDFTIAGIPLSRVIDIGASTSYTINLGYLYGFAHPLTLSVTGLPSGASASFTPNPVNPPTASSTMNVSTIGSTPAGTYVLTVQGTGSQTRTFAETLVVNAAPSAFNLSSPTNGSTVSTLTPTLTWQQSTDPDPQDVVKYILYYTRKSDFSTFDSIPNITTTSRTLPAIQDDTVYYWKVRAVDKWGKSTWSTSTWNFRVYYPQQPNTFSLISPADRDTSWQPSVTLRWHLTTDPDPGDSVLYDVYIDSRSGFPQPRIISDLKDTSCVFTGSDDSTYYWKVLAKDTNTSGRWSTQTTWRFYIYVPQAPNQFALITPEDEDTVILHPKLTWHKATDPDPGDQLTYKVFWSLDSLVYTDSSAYLTDTSYTLPGLLNDNVYYWKVRVKDRFSLTAWSTEAYRSFRALNVAPASFTLISPTDTAWVSVLTPTLRWHKPYDPDPLDPISYIVYYSRDNTFAVYDSTLSSDTSKVMPTLFDDSTYYWKVKAKDSYGATSWSTPAYWRFHVYYPQQPNTFTLVLPLNNSTSADSVITFYWHSTTDPDPGDSILYDLYYADNPGFTGQVVISNLKDTSRTVTLRDDKSYYWKVLAKDINTSGRWSTDVFRVNTYVPQPPRAFSLRLPTNGDTLSSLDAALFWQKTTDPDPGDVIKYDLYYDTSETFTSPVIVPNLNDTSYSTPQLEPGTFYWWKVKAKDTNTTGTWSTQTFKFFVPSCFPGSVNGDDQIRVADVIYLINFLFKGGPEPIPVKSCGDVQCDGKINVTDAIYLINYLFKGGPPPGC
ncbi:MAG TPA: dockerin type I repeat-containing protein, partial [Terriglobales bacterium]|nr:dockerin type I repeat-containing protein [Terriglobales bacterium]